MKVYVDELPENCGKCCFGDTFCSINNKYILDLVCLNKKRKDCPLQSLSDYTKQVRKEAIKEILELIESDAVKYLDFDADAYALDYEELKYILNQKILDQIQGETKC